MTEISTKYYESDYPRLDPVEVEFWIENLLSDKYDGKQAGGQLELRGVSGDLVGFCCLGVYCDAKGVPKSFEDSRYYGPDHKVEIPTVVYGHQDSDNDGDWSWGLIPRGYAIPFAGPETANKDRGCMSDFDPFYGDASIFQTCKQGSRSYYEVHDVPMGFLEEYSLTALNDSGEFTFAQIADIIRYFL